MCIENTLIDISHESSLSHAEKVSLRLIAKEVKKLKADNKYFRKQLKSRVPELVWRNIEQVLKEK